MVSHQSRLAADAGSIPAASIIPANRGFPIGRFRGVMFADLYRKFPERFEIARCSSFDGAITRPAGTAGLVGTRQRAPKRRAKKTPALSRPSWQLTQREPWRLR